MIQPVGSATARPLSRLFAWLLLVACLGLVSPVAAQTQSPDDSSDTQLEDAELEVTLVEQTTWVDPDGEIMVRIALDGAPSDATVEVTLHERMRSRSDFLATRGREQLRGRLTDPPLVIGTVDELGATATARIPIRSGPQDPEIAPRLGIADPGIHPVDIAVYGPDRSYLGGLVTHVVRLPRDPDPAPPLEVVLTQRLDGGISHRADGSVEIDQATRETWTVAVDTMAGIDQPLALTIRPETVAALAASTSPLDQSLLTNLVELSSSALATSTFVEVDIDGMFRAGLGDEVTSQLELGHAELAAHVAPVDAKTWIADQNISDPTIDALAAFGIERMVVPHSALPSILSEGPALSDSSSRDRDTEPSVAEDDDERDPDQPRLGPFRLVTETGAQMAVLATDPHLQQHQRASSDPRLNAQHLLIDLAMMRHSVHEDAVQNGVQDVSPGVVALDLIAADIDPAFVAAVVAGIDQSPFLHAVDLDQAIGATSSLPAYRLTESEPDADLSGLHRDLNLVRLSIASFDGVFPTEPSPPEPGPDQPRDATDFDRLLAVAVSSRLQPAERSAYFTTIADTMDGLLAGIDIQARAITLPARDGTVPVTLDNTSGRPAVVALRFDSDRLDFPHGERLDVELQPGTTTVDVVVRARASGAFPLDIEVESPDGQIPLAASRYTVRSTAVSGVGLAISIAAVIVLAVWWVRTARRARAARSHQLANDRADGSGSTPPRDPTSPHH